MGLCASTTEDTHKTPISPAHSTDSELAAPAPASASTIDRRINKSLKEDEKQNKNAIKLLLLGAGECGKSTILKQMKILHKNGYSAQEKMAQIEIIFQNTLQSIQTLITQTNELHVPMVDTEHKTYAEHIMALGTLFPSAELTRMIHTLFTEDASIQTVMNRKNEFYLLDSATYFLSNIGRILATDYLPSESDILRTRLPTSGIIESEFVIDSLSFRFFDVGGQRGERKKWIHCFDSVHAILFVASLNDYDQTLAEDNSKNRLIESLGLFEGILSLPWFKSTSIILFLNKNDLFIEKIKKIDISLYFPEFTGANGQDYEEALDFIKELFFNKNQNPNKTIYAHVTDATDTKQIEYVWAATKQIIMTQNLARAGLILQ